MATREIDHSTWREFVDAFSRVHDGWPITLEIMREDLGSQTEVMDWPLRGITIETRRGHETITIMTGIDPGSHLAHTIQDPSHLWVQENAEAVDQALEIESAENGTTLLRFRSCIPPEFLHVLCE